MHFDGPNRTDRSERNFCYLLEERHPIPVREAFGWAGRHLLQKSLLENAGEAGKRSQANNRL